ncbi:helix-hairpin-helix domain-containing protein [Streptomyces sp. B21-105]|uniref:helix-hairpin-helix domain-containing protein n=1 Tax=Streptomyces sp. B21-105 TaxID=3039417 RepID=UPI002FF3E803
MAKELEFIPVSRLKDVTEGRLRLAAIEAADLRSVRAVYEANRYELRQIPGVGAQTAEQALAAARQIARAVEETVSYASTSTGPSPGSNALVRALYRLVEAGPELRRAVDTADSPTGCERSCSRCPRRLPAPSAASRLAGRQHRVRPGRRGVRPRQHFGDRARRELRRAVV